MKRLIFIYVFLMLLNSCQSVTEGFKLKENSSDEFLVEKKNPLVLPPNFKELPSPTGDSLSSESNINENFEVIIKSDTSIDSQDQNQSKSNSAADTVLKNIKKKDVD